MKVDEHTLLQAGIGALLHDIGKTRIPKEILTKPGPLTPEERAVINTHPVRGLVLCQDVPLSQAAGHCILLHHERMAATGAIEAIRHKFDLVGLLGLSLATGLGGALLRDGIFLQAGVPAVVRNNAYLYAVALAAVACLIFGRRAVLSERFVALVDAAALGAYAAVGMAAGPGSRPRRHPPLGLVSGNGRG